MSEENTQVEEEIEVTEEQAEPTTAEDEKPKPKGGFQRRIDELTRNWREAERRNDELLKYITQQKQPEQEAAPPTLEEYGYDETKFLKAVEEHTKRLAREEASSQFQNLNKEQSRAQRRQQFAQREAEFAATVDDYAEKVYDPSVPVTEQMAEVIADSDVGPQVAYHLATHRDEAYRISQMDAVQAAREIGRIEARLSSAPAKKSVSQAPPPPPKIGAAEGEVDKDPDKMSVDEWMRWRNKQLKKR